MEAAHAETPASSPHDLTPAQADALATIEPLLEAETYATALLYGVTGSGKTEVYLRALERCRAQGRQAIVLVPEIALTPQTVRRFRRRFERVEVLHSAMTEARPRVGVAAHPAGRGGRRDRPAQRGVRAACPALGLIVVDEEQEGSFKQQHAPRYHARDVGIVRARAAAPWCCWAARRPRSRRGKNAPRRALHACCVLPDRASPGARLPERAASSTCATPTSAPRGGTRHLGRTLDAAHRGGPARGGGQVDPASRTAAASRPASRARAAARRGRARTAAWASPTTASEARALCHLCGFERARPAHVPRLRAALDGSCTGRRHADGRGRAARRASPTARVARMDSDTMTHRDAYETRARPLRRLASSTCSSARR